MNRRLSATGAAFLALALLTACGTPVPGEGLRSGISEAEVGTRIGAEPLQRETFSLPQYEDIEFTVLAYSLQPDDRLGEVPHWFLFNDSGLVTWGQGGVREARVRAFDTYYDWMAEQGNLGHGEAEREVRAVIAELYGDELNPAARDYLDRRVEVMTEVEADRTTVDEGRRQIDEHLQELQPGYNPEPGQIASRAEALQLLGMTGGYGLSPGQRARVRRSGANWQQLMMTRPRPQ